MKPKSLFKRVFDFARSEIERRAKLGADEAQDFEPARRHQAGPPAQAASTPAPVQALSTRAPWEDASHSPSGAVASKAVPAEPREVVTARKGLEAVRTGHAGLKLAWSLSAADVERARALTESEAVLCLRVVAFSPRRDDVLREVQDRPGVEREGRCELNEVDSRAVVAIGLRAGEHFVSIHHQTV